LKRNFAKIFGFSLQETNCKNEAKWSGKKMIFPFAGNPQNSARDHNLAALLSSSGRIG
jgi:hypothetical protein